MSKFNKKKVVPHNWIVFCLKLFQVHSVFTECIESLVSLWKTTLYLQLPNKGVTKLSSVSVNCGIFQGDTLSPLLFCIALTPLSLLLDCLSGYQATPDKCINHLLYMDDLKLFAKNDCQLELLLHTVKMFSDDLGLDFGLDKCAKLTVKRGRVSQTGDVVVCEDSCIRELNIGETYKYLGFHESDGVDSLNSKNLILDVYLQRLRLVWKSHLSGPRKVRATNSYCVPVLTYGFGIISWTKKEVQQFDVVTRKVLTECNSHHPRSSVERLYLPRTVAGRGLINIENLFYRKLVLLAHHLSSSADYLVQLCFKLDQVLPPRVGILSRARSYCLSVSIDTDFEICPPSILQRAICEQQLHLLTDSLTAKPLHGKYYTLLDSGDVDGRSSSGWLRQHLHSESESTVLAIQDQVIATRVYEAKIMCKRVPTLMCRLCGNSEETIIHLLSACSCLAATTYVLVPP